MLLEIQEEYCVMIKGSVLQEDKNSPKCVCTNSTASSYMKQKPIELKEETEQKNHTPSWRLQYSSLSDHWGK